MAVSALGPGSSECVWFLWEPFVSSLKTWDPLAFKARCLGDLSLRCRSYRLGCPLLWSYPLLLRRSSLFWVTSQLWVAVSRVGFMASLWLSLSCLDVGFLSFAWCAGIVEPMFRFFFLPEEIIPFVAVHWVCPLEQVSSWPSFSYLMTQTLSASFEYVIILCL